MINYVLKRFVKNLNGVSISADEHAVLRSNFLALTGLPALAKRPPLKPFFTLIQSKSHSHFKIRLVEKRHSEHEKDDQEDFKIQKRKSGAIVKVNLEVFDENKTDEKLVTPEAFVVMKIFPLN